MNKIDIALEDDLFIEVEYYYSPEELSYFNYKEGWGDPGSPAKIDDITVNKIVDGSLDDLCCYIVDSKDFLQELEDKIYESLE